MEIAELLGAIAGELTIPVGLIVAGKYGISVDSLVIASCFGWGVRGSLRRLHEHFYGK